jgi:hypothetical protein
MLIFAGYDPREAVGYDVCEFSIRRRSQGVAVRPLMTQDLRKQGVYWRTHEYRNGQAWDVVSQAPMATDFAISRFLVPALANYSGWALFCDFADMLFIGDVREVLAYADPKYAAMVVKHDHQPVETTKMDGQIQTQYARKNWSSFILFNCEHPANAALTPELVNATPGRDLHAFRWLDDDQIGALPVGWNHLVGVSTDTTPIWNLHYTLGAPFMAGYENGPFADIWWSEYGRMRGTKTNPSDGV